MEYGLCLVELVRPELGGVALSDCWAVKDFTTRAVACWCTERGSVCGRGGCCSERRLEGCIDFGVGG